ncbi:MAG: sulfatase [bacterium]
MSVKKINIVLIVIDALRAKNLGCYGMIGNPSPHIDQLAHQSILFENAYAAWNTTDQSLTSILTGKYPRTNGLMNHGDKVTAEVRERFNRTGSKLLAEILKQTGYKTMAVDWMGRWFKRGFDYYGYNIQRDIADQLKYYLNLPRQYFQYLTAHLPILKCYKPMRKKTVKDVAKGIKDVLSTFSFTFNLAKLQDAAFVTDIANSLISEKYSDPFFMFLHYWDTHTPYHSPKSFMEGNYNKNDPVSFLSAKYRGSVSYVDYHLGRLFAQLKKINAWDDTLLIITSDHGDSLTEHDIYFDHHGLYEQTTHVPLLLHCPDLFEKGKRVKGLVQHIDLLPTLYEILDNDYSSEALDGSSLFPLIEKDKHIRDKVFMEESYVQRKAAIRSEKYKYIMALDGKGWCNYCQKVHVGLQELYDLDDDPRELHDLTAEKKSKTRKMKSLLKDIINNLDRKRNESISNNQDNEKKDTSNADEEKAVRKRLKGLGYIS